MQINPQSNASIGICDSGVGGLTVLQALRHLLPNENFIYLGDTARLPYGNKSVSTITQYAGECCRFLQRENVKLIVIACHTVSSVAIESLRKNCDIPIICMLEPSVEQILSLTDQQKLVLLGTPRTIDAGIYEKLFSDLKCISSLVPLSCPLFVPLVEEGHISGSICDLVVETTLASLQGIAPTSLFLGCTHFPFLKEAIQKIMPVTEILDPAESVARSTRLLLQDLKMLNPSEEKGITRFYVTDNPTRFSTFKSQLLSQEGEIAELAILG